MTQRPDDTNPMDPFGMMKGMRDGNMEAWSKMMQQFVNTEAYSQASGAMLDAYLTTSAPFRKLLEQTMTQVLTQFNMPMRSDITTLAERLTNIEMRLDDVDAQLTTISRASSKSQAATSPAPAPQASAKVADVQPTAEAKAMDPVVDTVSETGNTAPPTNKASTSHRSSKTKEK